MYSKFDTFSPGTSLLLTGVRLCLAPLLFLGGTLLVGQGHPVLFDTKDPGIKKSIETWGLELTWPSRTNARRTLEFIGKDEIDFVRVGFHADEPLVGGELNAVAKEHLDEMAELALLAGADKPWSIMPATESGVDAWYKSGTEVVPSRWVQGLEAAVIYYDHAFVSVEPFNEPDYNWGQGTKQNLIDIMTLLKASTVFSNVQIGGPSTLNSDEALTWYEPIKNHVDLASTHTLAGEMETYIEFIERVVADGGTPVNPEAHNVVEVISGAEYGVKEAMWWAAASLTRSRFVKANQGMRLGYAEDRDNWTAAAVYRAPDGNVQAFLGASERQATTTTYQLISKDRDVYYDGHGPVRTFEVVVPGGFGYQSFQPNAERSFNVTWGEDIQPEIIGEYVLVNRASGKVMEVEAASQDDGSSVQQNEYTGGTHQQWRFVPLDSRHGGDYSYYSVRAMHSNKPADVFDWSLEDGGDVKQWTDWDNANQEWFIEYVEDGYFHMRSHWSAKYLEVADSSLEDGANIQQANYDGGHNQQWRLLPVDAVVEFDAPVMPVNLAARANAVSVELSWDANQEDDLDGYHIYRSSDDGLTFDLIARHVASARYVDSTASKAMTYQYKIRAIDRSLNRSPASEIVSAIPDASRNVVIDLDFEGNFLDKSGNENAVELLGNETYETGRLDSSAFVLAGLYESITLPSTLSDFDSLSITTWVNWNGSTDGQRIFDLGGDEDSYMYLTPKAEGAGLRFVAMHNGVEFSLDAPALVVGEWTHVSVSLGDGFAELFVDGISIQKKDTTFGNADVYPLLNYIGKRTYASSPRFNGSIDDFRVYNAALTVSEASALAGLEAAEAPSGFVGVWENASVELAWSTVVGAASYDISRSDSSDGTFTVIATGVKGMRYQDVDLVSGNEYYYSISAVNEAGASAMSETVHVFDSIPSEDWRLEHFGIRENSGDAADDSDPDGDGISNLLERAFGGDPKRIDWEILPKIDPSESVPALLYRKSTKARDLNLSVLESSSDISNWDLASGEVEIVSEEGDVQLLRFTRTIDLVDSLFLRIKIETQ